MPIVNGEGTPPRVWGKLKSPFNASIISWYTPTCVGKTDALTRLMAAMLGTPPRVWGKLRFSGSGTVETRYTPTCVGKTQPRSQTPIAARGTPPRVWGKLNACSSSMLKPWYTPTCVGKTPQSETHHPEPSVHPHVCGENSLSIVDRANF